MQAMSRLAVVLMLVVGCGGGSKSVQHPDTTTGTSGGAVADPIPTSAGPDCAIVADKLEALDTGIRTASRDFR